MSTINIPTLKHKMSSSTAPSATAPGFQLPPESAPINVSDDPVEEWPEQKSTKKSPKRQKMCTCTAGADIINDLADKNFADSLRRLAEVSEQERLLAIRAKELDLREREIIQKEKELNIEPSFASKPKSPPASSSSESQPCHVCGEQQPVRICKSGGAFDGARYYCCRTCNISVFLDKKKLVSNNMWATFPVALITDENGKKSLEKASCPACGHANLVSVSNVGNKYIVCSNSVIVCRVHWVVGAKTYTKNGKVTVIPADASSDKNNSNFNQLE